MLCPFHTEKRASFFIREHTLTFHCFGCEEKGSAFDFIMKKENVEFADALKILAHKVGIDTSQLINSNNYTRLFELNKSALQFYKETLMKNEVAMTYLLKERGLTQESIERFHLGYANNVSVVPFLRGKGFSDKEIIESGIGKAKSSGIKDHFWKRIIFPIIQRGVVRGFGGRIIGEGEPKYLNSPASPIFHKKEILYGLDAVAVREAGYALMVEGYMDVIMCHQHRYKNTVSTLGTAVGIEHIRLIRKYTDTLYTLFDGDAAGMRALEMTAKICFERKIKGGVIMLPEVEDPDSFLRNGGRIDVQMALPFSVFLSQKFPHSRKMIFNTLLRSGAVETSEFLSYMSSPEEMKSFSEINARAMLKDLLSNATLVLRKDNIEVRKYAIYLVLFSNKQFLFWEKIKHDFKKQADEMLKNIMFRKCK